MFNAKSLEEFFNKVNAATVSNITLYLIGGCNMSLRNLKLVTKDVDFVLLTKAELDNFKKAVEKLGYATDKELFKEAVYRDAVIVFKDDSGSRIDIFLKSICNQLVLSDGMVNRSVLHKNYGKIKVMLVSSEDIFLFKSLTGRPQDIDDCFAFIDTGKLDWKTIINECTLQHREKVKWIFWLFEQVCRIEDAKNIIIPAKRNVFSICKDNWSKHPTDFMLDFSAKQIKKHVPVPQQKEIIEAKQNESKI
ncbi:MAG: hypothetical protein V1859_02345 [archaeon]